MKVTTYLHDIYSNKHMETIENRVCGNKIWTMTFIIFFVCVCVVCAYA